MLAIDQIVTEIPFWVWAQEGEVPEAIWDREFETDLDIMIAKERHQEQTEQWKKLAQITAQVTAEWTARNAAKKKGRG